MLNNIIKKKIFLLGILFSVAFSASLAFASATNGTINGTYKYAWGENIGWLNFGCDNCNVQITDDGLSGYAWSSQYGWINLNPTTSGVLNNGEGTLSGYAWGSNIGWINFSGVTINSVGDFLGYATIRSDDSRINFNCANANSCGGADFKVKTDWRPVSTRPSGSSGGRITPIPLPPIIPPIVPPITPPITPPPPTPPVIISPTTTPPPPATLPPATSPPSTPPETGNTISELFTNKIGRVAGAMFASTRNFLNNSTVKTFKNIAIAVPIAISLLVLLASLLSGVPLLNYLFYLLVIASQFLGFTRKPKPWGTIYDSFTKRPLPFARVEILNDQSRKLQSTITDENGRYGFLISSQLQNIQLQAYLTKYDFPSKQEPSVVEQKLYPNIYKGGLVNAESGLTNFDLPMDPRDKIFSRNFYFGITSIKLNNLLTSAANVLFVVGAILGIANAIVNPSTMSFTILAVVLLTFILRNSGFKLKPFGLTKDTGTNQPLPFSLIALHNQGGERTSFTVSDDIGRYFLLTSKGNYTLKAYTPSHVSPTRTREIPISTSKGWINGEIEI